MEKQEDDNKRPVDDDVEVELDVKKQKVDEVEDVEKSKADDEKDDALDTLVNFIVPYMMEMKKLSEEAAKEPPMSEMESVFCLKYVGRICEIKQRARAAAKNSLKGDNVSFTLDIILNELENDVMKKLHDRRVVSEEIIEAADALEKFLESDVFLREDKKKRDGNKVVAFLRANAKWIKLDVFKELQVRAKAKYGHFGGWFVSNPDEYQLYYCGIDVDSKQFLFQTNVFAIPRELASDHLKVADHIRTLEKKQLKEYPSLIITDVCLHDEYIGKDREDVDLKHLQFNLKIGDALVEKTSDAWVDWRSFKQIQPISATIYL